MKKRACLANKSILLFFNSNAWKIEHGFLFGRNLITPAAEEGRTGRWPSGSWCRARWTRFQLEIPAGGRRRDRKPTRSRPIRREKGGNWGNSKFRMVYYWSVIASIKHPLWVARKGPGFFDFLPSCTYQTDTNTDFFCKYSLNTHLRGWVGWSPVGQCRAKWGTIGDPVVLSVPITVL